MEAFCRTSHHPNPLPIALLVRSKPFPPSFLNPSPQTKAPLPLRASLKTPLSSPKPKPKTLNLNPFAPLLTPALVAATTAAALLVARLQKPAFAIVASPPAPAVSEAAASSKDSETLSEEEKERILEEYLDSHPDDVKSLRALMEVKIKTKKLPDAIGIVDRLIQLEPGEKDLPLLKAHLQSYSGDAESAKRGFEELLEKDPFLVEAYHGLVMVPSQSDGDEELDGILKRVEDAMEMCKKTKKKEELRDFKLLVAQIRVIQGKYEEALKIYKELVKEEPRDFRPYLCQGIIYTLLRKKDEAEKQFQKYRRLVPKGHPYAQYFEQNMMAMKVFGEMQDNKRKGSLKG